MRADAPGPRGRFRRAFYRSREEEALRVGARACRPRVAGKFISLGTEKLHVSGATYGTFRPRPDGSEYPAPEVVERDFSLMAANGLNALRTYTVPPRSVLDAAQRYGLRVMVGLAAERYVGYLADGKGGPDIEELVRAGVEACAGHPAVLCYAIANEIPAPAVRWHGRRRIERWLKRLYEVAKREDPQGLVTYVNYPTTEYLELPFLDCVSFNVYLEHPRAFEAYLARLQNLAGDRPLLMTEIGLDSFRHGEDAQAAALDWQVRASFAAGCAGVFVYAWTDEWHRAGADVEDWDFGLTRRDRSPKPALATVRAGFAEVPFPRGGAWPCISVVLCSRNGSRTIRDCLEGLKKLEYPRFEVIVVDDGSTDGTADIASEYGFRVIRTEPRGLARARNTGIEAATGEIVAFIDDDAYPDRDWLSFLAATFLTTDCAGVGGPNIPPAGNGLVAEAVAATPGGPIHILLSDREAEHLPGCNMAFRKACLEAIDGFDPQFRVAGDDVDICWRLRQRGWRLGFSPGAMVWHHRRGSIRAFWKQQRGYGRAEAFLESKWPEKYNAAGHVGWSGQVYGKGFGALWRWPTRVYHGIWGSAPFQSLYQPASGAVRSLPQMPEWYLLSLAFAVLSVVGILWPPLWFLAAPLLALTAGSSTIEAGLAAAGASFMTSPRKRVERMKLFGLTWLLHLLQPLARLWGRLQCGLTPWRLRGTTGLALPWPRRFAFWVGHWQAPDRRLETIEAALRAEDLSVCRGGAYDRWDLEAQGGMLGAVRLLMAVEEHGAGRQLVRVRAWPRWSLGALLPSVLGATLATWAGVDQAWAAAAFLGSVSLAFALRALVESARATASVLHAIEDGVGATATVLRSVVEAGSVAEPG